jgi:hypothetical protein
MSIHPFWVTGNLTIDKGAANCRATRYKAMSGCQRPKTIPGNHHSRMGNVFGVNFASLVFFLPPCHLSAGRRIAWAANKAACNSQITRTANPKGELESDAVIEE